MNTADRTPVIRPQAGQALVESVVVVATLAGLCIAITWLGRLQGIDMQAMNVSRHQAFAHALQDIEDPARFAAESAYLVGLGQQWGARSGGGLLAHVGGQLRMTTRVPDVSLGRQAASLGVRHELPLGDEAVWLSRVSLSTAGLDRRPAPDALRDFDQRSMFLDRHTAILRGAGTAQSDQRVQSVLANAGALWAMDGSASLRAGRAADQRLRPLDAAWGRPDLQTDWLGPWAGWVPSRHLRVGDSP